MREAREARLRTLAALQREHDVPSFWSRPRSIRAGEPREAREAPSTLPPHPSMPLQYDSYTFLEPEIAALMDWPQNEMSERALEEHIILRNLALDLTSLNPANPNPQPLHAQLTSPPDDPLERRINRAEAGEAVMRRDALMRHFTERLAAETTAQERATIAATAAAERELEIPPRRSMRGRRIGGFDGLGDRDRSLSPEADGAWDTLQSTLTPDPQPPSAGSSFARVEEPEPPCDPLNEPDAGAQRPEGLRQSASLSRRSYADVLRVPSDTSPSEMAEDPEWLEGMHHIVRGLASRQDIPDEWWAQAGLTRSMSWEEEENSF